MQKESLNPELYRLAMHSIRDYAVFLIDPDGIVASWNIGAELMKQWKAHEIIGQHYRILFTPEDQEKGKPEHELKVTKERGIFEEEYERMRKDGSFFKANISLTTLYNAKGEIIGFVKVTRDMTDRVEAERKLLESQEELRKALMVRDEFLSVASHELKTPLTSLKLQCDLFTHKFKKGQALTTEAYEKFSRTTSKTVTKLTRLVDDMLDISRIQAKRLTLNKEDIELCHCLQEVIEQLKPVFNLSETSAPVVETCQEIVGHFDKLRLEQVFNNILTNAIRYGNGNSIKVKAEMRNQMALISVTDNGIGIPKEKVEKIFDRFERADRDKNVQGLGLGLYITKQIVEAHQGKIWVESEEGSGSTFYIQLPCFLGVHGNSEEVQRNYLKDLQ